MSIAKKMKDVTDPLDKDELCRRLNIKGDAAIRGARFRGSFAASWFVPIRDMRREAGLSDPPEKLFAWAKPAEKSKENS